MLSAEGSTYRRGVVRGENRTTNGMSVKTLKLTEQCSLKTSRKNKTKNGKPVPKSCKIKLIYRSRGNKEKVVGYHYNK